MKKNWFSRNGLALMVLVLFLGSLAWTWLAVQPLPTTTPVQEQYLNFTPDYTITATKSLSVWLAGTSLEQGRVGYFYAARPTVELKPVLAISGLNQGQLSGTVKTQVFLQAVNEKRQIYWTYPLPTIADQSFTLGKNSQDGTGQTSYQVKSLPLDVAATYDRLTAISTELNLTNATCELVVQYDVSLTGTSNGAAVSKLLQNTVPISLRPVSFTLPETQDNLAQVMLGSTADTAPSLSQQYLAVAQVHWIPLAVDLALLLALIVVLTIGKARNASDALDHRRFKEWITEGSFQAKDTVSIQILSLEGLVDLAIDLDKRVIHDPGRKQYFVLDDKVLYVYDPTHTRQPAASGNRPQLGKLLLDHGLLRPEQLETGLYYQQRTGSRLGETLVALGFIDEIALYSTLAAQQHFDYVELNPAAIELDRSWLTRMTLSQARVLLSLPLGERADRKMVIACGEPTREGVRKALQEFFGPEIVTVAARPSAISGALDRLDAQEKSSQSAGSGAGVQTRPPLNEILASQLTAKEWDRFYTSYYRGTLLLDLFLLGTGKVQTHEMNGIQSRESPLGTLVNRNIIDGETAILLKGLSLAVTCLDWQARQKHVLPGLLDLLQQANYLTPEMADWVNREQGVQKLPVDRLLVQNHLTSAETVAKAQQLLEVLKMILNLSHPD